MVVLGAVLDLRRASVPLNLFLAHLSLLRLETPLTHVARLLWRSLWRAFTTCSHRVHLIGHFVEEFHLFLHLRDGFCLIFEHSLTLQVEVFDALVQELVLAKLVLVLRGHLLNVKF